MYFHVPWAQYIMNVFFDGELFSGTKSCHMDWNFVGLRETDFRLSFGEGLDSVYIKNGLASDLKWYHFVNFLLWWYTPWRHYIDPSRHYK